MSELTGGDRVRSTWLEALRIGVAATRARETGFAVTVAGVTGV